MVTSVNKLTNIASQRLSIHVVTLGILEEKNAIVSSLEIYQNNFVDRCYI